MQRLAWCRQNVAADGENSSGQFFRVSKLKKNYTFSFYNAKFGLENSHLSYKPSPPSQILHSAVVHSTLHVKRLKATYTMHFNDLSLTTHAEPENFYSELRRLIANARSRIVISALYLGSGDKEKLLLKDIESALESNPELKISFLLDHSRARRGGQSSITLLSPLVDRFGARLSVSFYQMPLLRTAPYCWLPFWLQEVVAVYHCKVLILSLFTFSGQYS